MNHQSASKNETMHTFPAQSWHEFIIRRMRIAYANGNQPNLQFNVVVFFRNNFKVNFVFLKCVKISSDIVVLHKWWLVMYLLKKKQVYNNSE